MSTDDEDNDRPGRRFDDERDDLRPRRTRRSDEDFDDRPRRRRPEPGVDPSEFLIPTNVSAWSMAACYFGLFSCAIPVLGLLMAMIALPSGIVALRRRKKGGSSYGAVTGDIRAVIGIVCSSLTLLGYLIVAIILIVGANK